MLLLLLLLLLLPLSLLSSSPVARNKPRELVLATGLHSDSDVVAVDRVCGSNA